MSQEIFLGLSWVKVWTSGPTMLIISSFGGQTWTYDCQLG